MNKIIEKLKETARKYPDRTAFADPSASVSFAKLQDMTDRIATLLLRGSVCTPFRTGTPAAFYMEKSTPAVCALFGVIRAGGFYSFVDVRQPAERAFSVISVLDPPIIITDEENREALEGILNYVNKSDPDSPSLKPSVIMISELMDKAKTLDPDEALLTDADKSSFDLMPLYVNFTSGSTGTPKGVAVGQNSVVDFINEFTKVFDITSEDVIANQAPFDFDVSVKDIYSGIFTGARVQLIPREYFSNPTRLMDYLTDNKITTIIWAVSAMCFVSIMNGLDYKTPENLNKIMFSGEVMPVKHLNKWRQYLPDATYVNLYGPTEITCNCTYFILDREYKKDEIIPAGIPFDNEKVFLLDDNDDPVEGTDEEGEICVGGSCLALGYYRDKEKTDLAFVQNPLNSSFYERIYRTGDIGRYDEEGNLIYVSRKDFQIKHMGQRIELGEIEVSAMSVDGVSRACCTYDQKKKRINLYYTGETEKEALVSALQEKLPQFMVPGRTLRLDEMPLNKNGKIDRNALSGM